MAPVTQVLSDIVRMTAFFILLMFSCLLLIVLSPLLRLHKKLMTAFHCSEVYLPHALVCYYTFRLFFFLADIELVIRNKYFGSNRAVYIFNHTSNLDPMLMDLVCPHAKYLYKRSLGKIPLFGWMLMACQHISVDRGNHEQSIAAVNNRGVDIIANQGGSVALAPEGTRSRTGELQPFKKGGFHLARTTKAQIFPVVIKGAYDLCPPKSLCMLPGKVEIEVLEPITPEENESVDELITRVHRVYEVALKGQQKEIEEKQQEEEEKKQKKQSKVLKRPHGNCLFSMIFLAMFALTVWKLFW